MKFLLLLSILPMTVFAHFSKPQLVARFMYDDAWNAPNNLWCFSGEPVALNSKIYMNCLDSEGSLVAEWSDKGFEVMTRSEEEHLFSKPQLSFNRVSWYEFSEYSAIRSYLAGETLEKIEIKNLSTMSSPTDSFLPLSRDSFFFKLKEDTPSLWTWKNNEISPLFSSKVSYIFTPQIGPQGEIAIKTREINLNESSPDRLWIFDGTWRVVLEDKDANPSSLWVSFRHQMSVDQNKVLVIANDGKKNSLLLIQDGVVKVVATEGVELSKFDHFSPKLLGDILVVRGEDFEGQKAVYVLDDKPFRKLISQGDIVKTDRGDARVYYEQRDAIFYGAPGLDHKGNVYLQATLTDADHPKTLLGVGLIRFLRE
jgi:hypothetical protein